MLCVHPFASAMIENGQYSICASSKSSGITALDANLTEFFHGDYMQGVRSTMLSGAWPDHCEACKTAEAEGRESLRTKSLRTLSEEEITKPRLRYLDLRLSNRCNLGCRMCWPGQSSVIAEEQGIRMDIGYRDDTLDSIVDSGLRELYITGGEPLLVPENYQLLERLEKSGQAANMTLIMNTNCMVMPDRFMSLITQFKRGLINLSIDGHGPVQEYIRWPSKWSKIDVNLRRWLEFGRANPRFKLRFTPVIQVLNAPYLDEYLDYLRSVLGENPNPWLDPIALTGPNYMDLAHASDELWQRIDQQRLDSAAIRMIIDSKRQHRREDLSGHLRYHLTAQDKKRKINLDDYEPYFGWLR
jgi:sulfatase maturation enzyme AslB (radical SAM superfamily)